MADKKDKKPQFEAGELLDGRWEIVEHIATGGKGEVYRARQINLDRDVALKVISPEFVELVSSDEEEFRREMERFEREVRAMAQARHPNVVQVYDHGQVEPEREGDPALGYIVMEYVPGATLRERTPRQGFGRDEEGIKRWIRAYFLPMIDGVGAIHSLGIVHRDLKPENVLMDGDIPKITDFGLAGGPRWADQEKLTHSFYFVGTVPYMPREQWMEMDQMDLRGDIYALGKILYEALVGKMGKDNTFPFQSVRLVKTDTPFLKRLDRVIQRATADDREERISSSGELKEALLEALADEGPREPAKAFPVKMVLLGLAAVLAASIGVHVLYHRVIKPRPEPPLKSVETPPKVEVSALPRVLKGADGATLRLIPGGEAVLPGKAEKLEVGPFYLDETEVTNHQYATFLNRVASLVRVEEAVVVGDGKVWLHLGRVGDGAEPIVFKEGKFTIDDPALHSHAVVRVSALGAAAFAGFYGRRLPTIEELALAAESSPRDFQSETAMHGMHTTPAPPRAPLGPVALGGPNEYGVRGVLQNVDEWAVSSRESPKYVLFGAAGGPAPYKIVERPRFDVDSSLGFRCAVSPEDVGTR